MGNCQAIDTATIVIQHPCGKTDRFYWPVPAKEVMKSNPGHYVALLLTTTTYSPPLANLTSSSTNTSMSNNADKHVAGQNGNNTIRVTRIKLLRPTDMLIVGQVYRLITNQEVTKGLSAKKYAKMKQKQNESNEKQESIKQNQDSNLDSVPHNSEIEKNKQVLKQERPGSKTPKLSTGTATKLRPWQPSLNSISESTS